jgi:hypothetical protein
MKAILNRCIVMLRTDTLKSNQGRCKTFSTVALSFGISVEVKTQEGHLSLLPSSHQRVRYYQYLHT